MLSTFKVSKLPVENRSIAEPFMEISDFKTYRVLRASLYRFCLNSESTAFISLSVALSVKSGVLKN